MPNDMDITLMIFIGTVGCICALLAFMGWAADWLAQRIADKQ